ncbi:MAG: hypothetical protein ACRYFZ_01710 [Janthinobacterium lividum]
MLPPYHLALHQPPLAVWPTLTVTARGRVYLSKALLTTLGLRAGQPVDLLPPSAEHAPWQLDLRPTAARRLHWYPDTRPRIDGVRLPAALVAAGVRLTLALAPTPGPGLRLYPLTAA